MSIRQADGGNTSISSQIVSKSAYEIHELNDAAFNDRSKMFHSHRFLSAPRDQSFASYLHKCMSQCPELFRSGRLRGQNDMVPFLLKEIPKLLHFNEDGANIALQLYLDLKIHVLPLKLHYRSGSYHDVIDKEVSKLLRDGRDSGTLEYHDLGWQCRRVREQMQTCPGADFNPEQFDERSCLREQHCHHNLLLPTLDTLQRHAYEQIHESVHLAVQSRLPPELQRMVFEYAMFSEEIPLDPRAIVHVEKIAHTTTNVPALVGSRPLLARSFCSHKDLFHYYLCDYYRMPNGTRVYWEPEWKATIPKFPHNDEVQWKQELRKLDYHMLR
ncbi:hypothetical protein BU23DRAFT_276485 [Bimuria novae-zelandiae CBS 107.79]|uniref:Uncharacterized protein n=1 Tax=Bimuria novae-zelandiae CBS 107.79 TaxID=1447943 RepID=A0A6A5VKW0_9PLEO|nr:hypothetical protein BU23DRAFT_276485 [Bimuria novae-zelandiae CBS 107.79]